MNRIRYSCCGGTGPGGPANDRVDALEIIADATGKNNDPDNQGHADVIHDPPHVESIKAVKQRSSHPSALVWGPYGDMLSSCIHRTIVE